MGLDSYGLKCYYLRIQFLYVSLAFFLWNHLISSFLSQVLHKLHSLFYLLYLETRELHCQSKKEKENQQTAQHQLHWPLHLSYFEKRWFSICNLCSFTTFPSYSVLASVYLKWPINICISGKKVPKHVEHALPPLVIIFTSVYLTRLF